MNICVHIDDDQGVLTNHSVRKGRDRSVAYWVAGIMVFAVGCVVTPTASAQFSVGQDIPWEAVFSQVDTLYFSTTNNIEGITSEFVEKDPGRLFAVADGGDFVNPLFSEVEGGPTTFAEYYFAFVEEVIMNNAYTGHSGAMVTALNANISALNAETSWVDLWTSHVGATAQELENINLVTAMLITGGNFDFVAANVTLDVYVPFNTDMDPGNYTTFPVLKPLADIDGDNVPNLMEQNFTDQWIIDGLADPAVFTNPAAPGAPGMEALVENAGAPFAVGAGKPILWSDIERLLWYAGALDGLADTYPELSSTGALVSSNATAGVFHLDDVNLLAPPPEGVVPDTFYLFLAERIITDSAAPGHNSAMLTAYNNNYKALWADVPSTIHLFDGAIAMSNPNFQLAGNHISGRTIALYTTIVDLSFILVEPAHLTGVSMGQILRLLLNFTNAAATDFINDSLASPSLTPASYTYFPILGPDGDPDGDTILNKDEGGFNPESFVGNCLTPQTVNVGSGGGTVTHENGTSLTIPPGALSSTEPIGIEHIGENDSDFDLAAASVPGAFAVDPFNVYRILNVAALGGSVVSITVTYPDADQDGFHDTLGIPESEIELFVFDVASNQFVTLPNLVIDTVANTITASYSVPSGKAAGDIVVGTGGSIVGTPAGGTSSIVLTLVLVMVAGCAVSLRKFAVSHERRSRLPE